MQEPTITAYLLIFHIAYATELFNHKGNDWVSKIVIE